MCLLISNPSYGQVNGGDELENKSPENVATSSPSLAKTSTNPSEENEEKMFVPEHDVDENSILRADSTEVTDKIIKFVNNQTDTTYRYEFDNMSTTPEYVPESTTILSTTDLPDTTPRALYPNEFFVDDFCICNLQVSYHFGVLIY